MGSSVISTDKKRTVQHSVQGFEPIPKKSATIRTDKPRPHVCSTCTRAFARLEHLKRHERSHTNEKPFQCAACGRCFARRDLVLRHQQKLHSSLIADTASSSSSSKKNNNQHIITNYGNKQVQLPTASMIVSNDSIDSATNTSSIINTPTPNSTSTTHSSSTATTNSNNSNNQNSSNLFKRHRHNSFSASSAASYTPRQQNITLASSTGDITSALSNEPTVLHSNSTDLPEAPHQVGFATPQLSAQDLASTALLSGFDLSALGINELKQHFTDSNIDQFNLSDSTGNNHHNSNHNDDPKSNQDYFSQKPSPYQFHITPGGSLIDMPILNEFLHIGGQGGGAGFTLNKSTASNSIFEFPKRDLNMSLTSSNLNQHQNQHQSASQTAPQQQQQQQHHPNQKDIDQPDQDLSESSKTPEDWLCEFINTPFEQNFNTNLNNTNFNSIGFSGSSLSPSNSTNSSTLANSQTQPPHLLASSSSSINSKNMNLTNNTDDKLELNLLTSSTTTKDTESPNHQSPHSLFNNNDNISSLFISRQIDLFNKSHQNSIPSIKFFTPEYRNQILKIHNLSNESFPSIDELNSYIQLYTTEFNKYFPFIHLQTLKPNIENYPLILTITSIGALYDFHSTHAMSLFNISRFCVHEFLEHEKNFSKSSNIPLWLYQSMVLLIFIGIFNNDPKITKSIVLLSNSLIELIKLTGFNLSLETFQNPPIPNNFQYSKSNTIQNTEIFNYFIFAQSRIRTCHTVLLLSNLFSSLIGLNYSLHSIDIQCGVHCKNESMWNSSNSEEWFALVEKQHYVIDSKFSLIELSNGNDSYQNCLNYLTLNNYILQSDFSLKNLSMHSLLSLLMSVHEKIFLERMNLKTETNEVIKATKWRMNSRPIIESLIKSWESIYVKNNGVLYWTNSLNDPLDPLMVSPNSRSNSQSTEIKTLKNPTFKLILPLLSLAKIRKCLYLSPVIETCWEKNWNQMNHLLDILPANDPEALKEATTYALDIINLWIDYVSVVNDAEKTSIRTPIFFLTCIFTSLLVIAEFLFTVEQWSSLDNDVYLNAIDRSLWLKSEIIFKKVESLLLKPNNTYSEFLRLESNGALDVEGINDEIAKYAMNPNTAINESKEIVKKARLASRGLYLGVRILGDAPIWPIALLFAQALKKRAVHIQQRQSAS